LTQLDYFQYYGLYKEGFGCFDCNDLFSLVQTTKRRCIPKEDDPKAVNNPDNKEILNCASYQYENSGKLKKDSQLLHMY
jgi:hypothetical protein